MADAGTGLARCPFCTAELASAAAYCDTCGAVLLAPNPRQGEPGLDARSARRLATNRREHGDEPLVVWGRAAAADDPGLTFDPIKIGPDTCSGCESSAVFVVDGQAAVYSLEGCDDDWCYYENPQGIV